MTTQIRSIVWTKGDLAGILAALAMTAQTGDGGEFTRGYLAALAALAMVLNIAPGDVGVGVLEVRMHR